MELKELGVSLRRVTPHRRHISVATPSLRGFLLRKVSSEISTNYQRGNSTTMFLSQSKPFSTM